MRRSRQCFLYALGNRSVFLGGAAWGQGCPGGSGPRGLRVAPCLSLQLELPPLPALDSFHMCCWFSLAYFFGEFFLNPNVRRCQKGRVNDINVPIHQTLWTNQAGSTSPGWPLDRVPSILAVANASRSPQ